MKMTKLEELKAAYDDAEADAAWYAAYAADWDAAYDVWNDVCGAARDAYEAELKKQGEKQNELELSTNEAHKT